MNAVVKIWQGLRDDCGPPPVGQASFLDGLLNNIVVSFAGPAMPFILIPLQMVCLPYPMLRKNGVIGTEHSVRCLPRDWAPALLTVWLAICITRLGLYLVIGRWHCFFSDHIFLITSVISQIQMKIFLAEMSRGISSGGNERLLIVAAWCLLMPYLFVSGATIRQFHTIEACITAFVGGTLLFSGIAFWWSRILRFHGRENNKCALLVSFDTPDDGDNNVVDDKNVDNVENTVA
jgi:hypothetical protein